MMPRIAHLIALRSSYDDDGHFNCLSTCCHQRIPQADSTYKFCPFCGTPLSGEVDDSARPSWIPRWHARAIALGIDPDKISRPRTFPIEYLWTHERFSAEYNRWERVRDQDGWPTTDRRLALHGFKRSLRHSFAGWRYRMVCLAINDDCTETTLGYALDTTLTEHTILSERSSFLASH